MPDYNNNAGRRPVQLTLYHNICARDIDGIAFDVNGSS